MRGNPHKGEVVFEAGGKKYILRLGINAICELESELDLDITRIGQRLVEERGVRLMRSVFRSLVRPTLTDEQTGDLIDQIGLAHATELMSEAFNRAFDRESETRPPVAAVAPTGTAT